jgi:hypothetical protein
LGFSGGAILPNYVGLKDSQVTVFFYDDYKKKLDPRLHGDDEHFITVTPAQAGGKRPEGYSSPEYLNLEIVYSRVKLPF